MNNIDFQIRNPAAEPPGATLYLGEENTLQLIFTNDLGIEQLNPGDQFTVVLPRSLLQVLDPTQFISPDWHLVSQTTMAAAFSTFKFVVTPARPIDFTLPTTLSFARVKCTQTGNDAVRTSYLIKSRPLSGTSQKLFVLNPPGQLSNLHDVLSFHVFINVDQQTIPSGVVYISPDNLAPPVANTISVNLKYAGNYLVQSWPADLPPRFLFSFSCGQEANSLTDDLRQGKPGFNNLTTAWSMQIGIDQGESSQWMPPLPPDTSKSSPTWDVAPAGGNSNLFSSEQPNLDIDFKHVVTILPPGGATLYIQWTNVPGYRDGVKALDLKKEIAQPRVIAFSALSGQSTETIAVSAPVELEWNTFAAHEAVLSWTVRGKTYTQSFPAFDDLPPQLVYTGKASLSISQPVNQFEVFISARSKSGDSEPSGQRVVVYRIPHIRQFSALLGWDDQGAYLEFRWEVEGADSGTIGGINVTSVDLASGIYRQRFTNDKPFLLSYTLTVNGANGQQDSAVVRGELYLEQKVLLGTDAQAPMSIALTPDGKRAYVTGSDVVQSIYSFDARHPPTNADLIDTTAAFPRFCPRRIAISADGARAYILFTNVWDKSVSDFVCICDPAMLGDLADHKDNVVPLGQHGCADIAVTMDQQVYVTRAKPDGYVSFDGNATPPRPVDGLSWKPAGLPSGVVDENGIFGEPVLWLRFAPDGVRGLMTNGGNNVGYFNGGKYTLENPFVISAGNWGNAMIYSASLTGDCKHALIAAWWGPGVYCVDLDNPPSTLPDPTNPRQPWPVVSNVDSHSGLWVAMLPNGTNAVVVDSSACWSFDIGDPTGPQSITTADTGNPCCLVVSRDGTKIFTSMFPLTGEPSYVAAFTFQFDRINGHGVAKK